MKPRQIDYTPVKDCLEAGRNGRFCAGAESAIKTIESLREQISKLIHPRPIEAVPLSFELPLPPTVNDYYKPVPMPKQKGRKQTARLVLSKAGKKYAKLVGQLIMVARSKSGWPQMFGSNIVGLRIHVHFGSHRIQDISNRVKPLEDSLAKAGVYDNDTQVKALIVLAGENRKPGVVACSVWRLDSTPDAVQGRLLSGLPCYFKEGR